MEGRVAILSDGDPTALIVPVTLFAFYQSPDDYNNRWIVGSFVRMIRLVSFLIAFLLPAIYIATVAFHPDVLPLELVYTIKASLEKVPLPPIFEALLMELIFELLREAGIRLPSRVGQTIGIVGGLVIGDAIVKAGLVSYTMIIVVALTAISSFLVPSKRYEFSSSNSSFSINDSCCYIRIRRNIIRSNYNFRSPMSASFFSYTISFSCCTNAD